MPLNWTTTDVAGVTHGCKICVYGDSGVGKTVLCATAPNVLFITVEKGLLSVRKTKRPVLIIRSLQDLMDAYVWVRDQARKNGIDTVAIDSLSEVAEVILHSEKQNAKDPRQAYGAMNDHMDAATKAFRDLEGIHVIFIAKMELVRDDVANVNLFMPMLPGKQFPANLPYLLDGLFRLCVGKTPEGQLFRYLQTQPDLQSKAKDRSGNLAQYERPDLTYVFQQMVK